MPVLVMGVDISSAGSSDRRQGSVVFVSEKWCLGVKYHSESNGNHILFLQYLSFFLVPLPALPASRDCSWVAVWMTSIRKRSGSSCPVPPLWVGQHLSNVWSLDGSAWPQVMTPQCGVCIAQVWRAIIISWEAHQAIDPDMFIPFWTGSWFYLVGRERLANSQKHQICRWVSWGKEKGKEKILQETKILLFCLQAPSWHNFVSKQVPFRTLAPLAFGG